MEIRRQMGNTGEDIALEYLTAQGYCLIQRNFTCKTGEIDLILQKGDILVFAEVRSRTGHRKQLIAKNKIKSEKLHDTIFTAIRI